MQVVAPALDHATLEQCLALSSYSMSEIFCLLISSEAQGFGVFLALNFQF